MDIKNEAESNSSKVEICDTNLPDEEAESIARVTVMLDQVRELTDNARSGRFDRQFPRIGNAMGRIAIARLRTLLREALDREEDQLLFDDADWNSEDRRFFALGVKYFGVKSVRRTTSCEGEERPQSLSVTM